ncbi:hypothetical protein QBC46DRAFT_451524 [Diplogelasinospora grovesii]|uniref:DUF676 domain-containing protein n=1 Tax=Diplogelasinospora grovesii TaxID=303347 RepID=A0AAN6S301_9PEZI|nr:hypothetical protein QBC46DRAFT_451524 [Diplogelasinospora grovesii]
MNDQDVQVMDDQEKWLVTLYPKESNGGEKLPTVHAEMSINVAISGGSSDRENTCSIVAGLGGHHIETWKADDHRQTVWPCDLLPEYIPGIRVLSFNYATTIHGRTSNAGIRDRANDLLGHLLDIREDDQCDKSRPIVFVGHSLGGFIIKRAIRAAHYDERFLSLAEATRGVMFFATPHYGVDASHWEDFVLHVLQRDAPIEGAKVSSGMLKEVKENSRLLQHISEDFEPFHEELGFVTFLEESPLKDLDYVFSDSAQGRMRAPTEHSEIISGDHFGICKFGDDERDQFLPVWKGIQSLIKLAPKAQAPQLPALPSHLAGSLTPPEPSSTPPPARDADTISALSADEQATAPTEPAHAPPLPLSELQPVSVPVPVPQAATSERNRCHDHQKAKGRRKPTKGTCKCISKRKEFKDWFNNTPDKQRLWICGPPACGKSYLARYIITKLRSLKSLEVAHCFLSDSIPARGNLEALLRATLHQALRLLPELVREFMLPKFGDTQRQEIWTEDALRSLWVDVMVRVTADRPLAIVNNGFDEIKQQCQEAFFGCLKDFEEKSSSRGNVRLLLLSRGYRGINAKPSFNKLKVKPGDTTKDIKKSIKAGLSYLEGAKSYTAELLGRLCERILECSNGVYLPATLIVDHLRLSHTVPSDHHMLEMLESLWDGIAVPYDYILGSVLANQDKAIFIEQVLRWVAFQQEGLTAAELNIGQALGRALNKYPGQEINGQKLGEFLEDSIETTVDRCCGQLVKFGNGRFELVHGSLKKYLTKTDNLPRKQYMEEGSSHATLTSLCAAYLTMPVFSASGTTGSERRPEIARDVWESKVRKRVTEHKFARYAALHWSQHLKDAGRSLLDVSAEPDRDWRLLEDGTTHYAICWTEVWWFFMRWLRLDYPPDCPVRQILMHNPFIKDKPPFAPEDKPPKRGWFTRGTKAVMQEGLHTLRNPEPGHPLLDVVVVHGLNGDCMDSWTDTSKRGNATMWPRDLLPEKLPGVHVMTFQYNSSVIGNTSVHGVRDNAIRLISVLRDAREEYVGGNGVLWTALGYL